MIKRYIVGGVLGTIIPLGAVITVEKVCRDTQGTTPYSELVHECADSQENFFSPNEAYCVRTLEDTPEYALVELLKKDTSTPQETFYKSFLRWRHEEKVRHPPLFAPNNDYILLSGDEYHLLTLPYGKLIRTFYTWLGSECISPDSRWIALEACSCAFIRFHDVLTGLITCCVAPYTGYREYEIEMKFAEDSQTFTLRVGDISQDYDLKGMGERNEERCKEMLG